MPAAGVVIYDTECCEEKNISRSISEDLNHFMGKRVSGRALHFYMVHIHGCVHLDCRLVVTTSLSSKH